ncbi:MAG: BamA/TamA family outer membrane protein [Burkholderiaceae bacterium]
MRAALASLIVFVAATAAAQDRLLARFDAPGAPAEVAEMLVKLLEARQRIVAIEADLDAADEERLLRQLREDTLGALATEGYFAPSIRIAPDRGEGARYVLQIELGPRARIGKVDLVLRGPIEKQPQRIAELRAAWELAIGAPFRDSVWSTAKSRLLARVQEKDYAAARLVDSLAEVDPDAHSVSLRVEIDSGPPFTVGELQIEGLKRYGRDLVERFNPTKPGDRYDVLQLLEFQRRMQRSPYFSSVGVVVEPDPQRADRAPIVVKVTEAQTKRVSFGLGYSTNTGPRAEALYRQALIFGYPYTLQTGVGVDRTRAIVYSDLLLPPKPNGALDSLGVLYERSDIEDVITHRWGAGAARTHLREAAEATIETRLALNLQRELRRNALTPDVPGVTSDTAFGTYTWTRRAVDEVTDPRRGHILSGTAGAGINRDILRSLVSNVFTYTHARYVRYQPLPLADPKRNVLIARVELGRTFSDNPDIVPKDLLFTAGGVGSVRGYAYQALGRRAGTARPGGTLLAVGSLEAVHWFSNEWGGAVFVDVGDAADSRRELSFGRGAGFGARWKTLAGPLALDLAYGERRPDGSGGRWRVHFAVAIAF